MENKFNPDEYLSDFNPDEYLQDEPAVEIPIAPPESEDIIDIPTPLAAASISGGLETLVTPTSNLAEDLAFRAIGGKSTSPGLDLVKEQAKNIKAIDPIVNPRNVGRAVLDANILGPLGISGDEAKLNKATNALVQSAAPTNQLLSEIKTPISKQDVAQLMDFDLNLENLDMAIPENKLLNKAYNKRLDDLTGLQTALDAEKSKRQLQKSINYGSDKGAAKTEVSKAQARATRELVEEAARLEGKLEDLKSFKKQSGNLAAASDIIESNISAAKNIPSTSGRIASEIGSLATEKIPGVAAKALDKTADVLKKSKALGPAAALVAAPFIYDDATDRGLEGAEAIGATAGELLNPVPFTDVAGGYIAGKQEFKQSGSFPKAVQAGVEGYSKPLVKKLETSAKGRAENIASNINAFDTAFKAKPKDKLDSGKFTSVEPEAINALSLKLEAQDDKAAQEYARVLRGILSSPNKSKEATLSVLNQQPAFREIIRKLDE